MDVVFSVHYPLTGRRAPLKALPPSARNRIWICARSRRRGVDLLHVSDDRPLLFAAIDFRARGVRRRRRRTVGRRLARGRAGLGVGARRYVTHARRPCRVGRRGLLRGLAGRRGTRLVHGAIIQAIEHDTQHNCDGDGVHCDLGAAGGTFGKLRISLQLIVGLFRRTPHFLVTPASTMGIVRIGLVCHACVPPVAPQLSG